MLFPEMPLEGLLVAKSFAALVALVGLLGLFLDDGGGNSRCHWRQLGLSVENF